MALKNKLARERYAELRNLYNYSEDDAEAEANEFAKAVAAAKPKKKRQVGTRSK